MSTEHTLPPLVLASDFDRVKGELAVARAEIERLTAQNDRLIKDYAGRDDVHCACEWSLDGDTVVTMCMAHHEAAESADEVSRLHAEIATLRAVTNYHSNCHTCRCKEPQVPND